MGKVIKKPGELGQRFRASIEDGLKARGIESTISAEKVGGTKLIRLFVMAKKFDHLPHTERQNIVWRIIGENFTDEEQLKISMIYTLSRSEVGKKLFSELSSNN